MTLKIPQRYSWIPLLFIWLMSCTPAQVSEAPAYKGFPGESVTYSIHQELTLYNSGPKTPEQQNLWVALIRDFAPYQRLDSREIKPVEYTLITDEYGNQYAEFELSDHPPETKISIKIEYEVTVFEQRYELGTCEGELPEGNTHPELHIESANPQIQALSKALSTEADTVCDQVRAFYDYAGDELTYTFNQKDWGAQAALGPMGADCTEYASLMMALSRAAGIPARYYEGILYLGAQPEGIAQTEHAWLDVYLPGTGWAMMDPTLGRGTVFREVYFAHHTPDHIILTTGRSPSTLRGSSYWSHLYWPGDSTQIEVTSAAWEIVPIE